MADYLWSTALLVHLAALLQVFAYLLRDQIRLRLLMLCGSFFYCLYYIVHPATPMWDAAFWTFTMAATNAGMIVVLMRDRRPGSMPDGLRTVHALMGAPLPGHFRRIMRISRRVTAGPGTVLARRGEVSGKLYFVHRGPCRIDQGDRALIVDGPAFIGEVSMLLGTGANATVTLPEGGVFDEWDTAALGRLFDRYPQVRVSFDALLTRNMALKMGGQPDMPCGQSAAAVA